MEEAKKLFKQKTHENMLKKMKQYAEVGILCLPIFDKDMYIVDVKTEVPKYTNQTKNEEERKEDSFNMPMPIYAINKTKKFNAVAYSVLSLESKYSVGEPHRYVYVKDLDFKSLAKEYNISYSTLMRNIKQLSELDCKVVAIEKVKEGLVYKLNYCNVNDDFEISNYTRIHTKILRNLLKFHNNGKTTSNLIKAYCVIKFITKDNTKDFTTITNKQLCEMLGLSSKSKNNIQVITDLTTELEILHLIETRKSHKLKTIEDSTIKMTIVKDYRICTLEEWEKPRLIIEKKHKD